MRVLVTREGEVVALHLFDDAGEPQRVEAFYPDVVRALRALPLARVVIGGTLVAFDPSGHPSLRLLAQRTTRIAKNDEHRATTSTPVVLVVSDVLALGEADLRPLPLSVRREQLAELLPQIGLLTRSPPLDGPLANILAFCMQGIVSKNFLQWNVPPGMPAWVRTLSMKDESGDPSAAS